MMAVDMTVLPALLIFWHMDRYMHFLDHWYMDFLINGNVFDDWNVLIDWNLLDVVMVNGVHLVRNVNNNVFAAIKERIWINIVDIKRIQLFKLDQIF